MKLQTKNLFQPLTDHLEAMIASGHYPTGTRLPSLRRPVWRREKPLQRAS